MRPRERKPAQVFPTLLAGLATEVAVHHVAVHAQSLVGPHLARLERSFQAFSVALVHSGNIRGTFREHSGNIQGTFREHWGNIGGTFMWQLMLRVW